MLLAGAITKGLGEISASFAVNNVAALFLTSGVVTGVGYSMIYLVSSYSVAVARADRTACGYLAEPVFRAEEGTCKWDC